MAISRIDHHNTHGWTVRVARGSKLHGDWREINALFSDKKCGGKQKARKMAEAYEKRLLEEFPPLPFRQRALHGSNTAIPGISFTFKRGRHDKSVKNYGYSVNTKEGEQRKCKFFSLDRYGHQTLETAVAFRRKWEVEQAARQGIAYTPPPSPDLAAIQRDHTAAIPKEDRLRYGRKRRGTLTW